MKKTDEKERKLSKAERKRQEKFEIKKREMLSDGYEMKEHTLGIVYANIMAVVVSLPLMLPMIALYIYFNWGKGSMRLMDTSELVLFGISVVAFIVIHELVHGATWACFSKHGFKSISFGIMAEMCTPYCTCSEPLKKGSYLTGTLMPLFIVGFLPSVIAAYYGYVWLFVTGLIMIMGAGGDIIISHRLVRYKSEKADVVYYDHPTKCGFITFER